MTWLKYSDAPILVGEQIDRDQSGDDRLSKLRKPNGFWITDDSEDCWRSWCVGERWSLGGLTHKHEIELDESGILLLRSIAELDGFTDKFGIPQWWGPVGEPNKYRDICIDWHRVAEQHTGLIITPYQWERRLHEDYDWYYGWDCASGCIWKASAIVDIRLIEIDLSVIEEKQEAAA